MINYYNYAADSVTPTLDFWGLSTTAGVWLVVALSLLSLVSLILAYPFYKAKKIALAKVLVGVSTLVFISMLVFGILYFGIDLKSTGPLPEPF